MTPKAFILTLALLLLSAMPALAVIEALTPLSKFQRDADFILVARVERMDIASQRAVLIVEEQLKGKSDLARVPIRLGTDADKGDAADVLGEISIGTSMLLFITSQPQQELAYAYCEGRWFQLTGVRTDQRVQWQYQHGEPYLRRSYADTTQKLILLLRHSLAGQSGLPEPDSTIAPGFGLVTGHHEQTGSPPTVNDEIPVAAEPTFFRTTVWIAASIFMSIALLFVLTRSTSLDEPHV